MIVMGGSLGGMKAVKTIFSALPPSLAAPILLVLHRQRLNDDGLIEVLQKHSRLPIREAMDKEPIQPGYIYLAPSDYHILVDSDCEQVCLTVDALFNFARPSIDVLFLSAAENLGSRAIAVVLSGANRDGAVGAAAVEERGGRVIVSDPATAECAIMPEAALHVTKKPFIRAVDQIAPLLLSWLGDAREKEYER